MFSRPRFPFGGRQVAEQRIERVLSVSASGLMRDFEFLGELSQPVQGSGLFLAELLQEMR